MPIDKAWLILGVCIGYIVGAITGALLKDDEEEEEN